MVEQLQEQMQTANINKTLISNMFHSDFKYHLKALNTLLEVLIKNTPSLNFPNYTIVVFFT